jgi:hypothetical protein
MVEDVTKIPLDENLFLFYGAELIADRNMDFIDEDCVTLFIRKTERGWKFVGIE